MIKLINLLKQSLDYVIFNNYEMAYDNNKALVFVYNKNTLYTQWSITHHQLLKKYNLSQDRSNIYGRLFLFIGNPVIMFS